MLDFIVGFLRDVCAGLVDFLPQSPFQEFYGSLTVMHEGLSWLNWFVPFGTLLAIMSVWLVAVAGFYAWRALLHWIGLID